MSKTKVSTTKPAPTSVSISPEPPEPVGFENTDLDTIAEHALAALATRFATASGAVQDLFEAYTRQAQDILNPAHETDTTKTPDVTDDEYCAPS